MRDVLLPGAAQFDLASKAGRSYRIFVWQPSGAASGPRPVVYLLDGNGTFPVAVSAAALQSRRPERTGVQPAVIVGIGYPTDDWIDAERRTYDYTPALLSGALPQRPDGHGWGATGGADEFLDFIADELQPRIAAEFGADGTRCALFGHSFGGLFALHALFTRPQLFRSYAAASPSIWFGSDHLAAARARFAAHKPLARRLLISVGSLEQAGDGASADYDIWILRNRMVDNACALAADLSVMERARLETCFVKFADENHASVVPAAISRALRFALGPEV